jgi:hypothetical protein
MSKKYEETFEEIIDEVVEDLPEIVEEIVPEPVKVSAKTHVVVAGDTFPSIAAKFKPVGKTKHEYAQELLAKNGSLSVGKVVVL